MNRVNADLIDQGHQDRHGQNNRCGAMQKHSQDEQHDIDNDQHQDWVSGNLSDGDS